MQTIKYRATAKVFCLLLIFVALAAQVSQALAQTADRPGVKVGDEWKFLITRGEEKSDCDWVITSVTPEKIEGTENGKPLALDADLNVTNSTDCETNDDIKGSQRKFLSFPLEVGKTWTFTKKWPWRDDFPFLNAKTSVVSYEKVQVPAGEFEAFKFDAKFVWVNCCGAPDESKVTYWYAPLAQAIVKFQYQDPSYPPITIELVQFQIQP